MARDVDGEEEEGGEERGGGGRKTVRRGGCCNWRAEKDIDRPPRGLAPSLISPLLCLPPLFPSPSLRFPSSCFQPSTRSLDRGVYRAFGPRVRARSICYTPTYVGLAGRRKLHREGPSAEAEVAPSGGGTDATDEAAREELEDAVLELQAEVARLTQQVARLSHAYETSPKGVSTFVCETERGIALRTGMKVGHDDSSEEELRRQDFWTLVHSHHGNTSHHSNTDKLWQNYWILKH